MAISVVLVLVGQAQHTSGVVSKGGPSRSSHVNPVLVTSVTMPTLSQRRQSDSALWHSRRLGVASDDVCVQTTCRVPWLHGWPSLLPGRRRGCPSMHVAWAFQGGLGWGLGCCDTSTSLAGSDPCLGHRCPVCYSQVLVWPFWLRSPHESCRGGRRLNRGGGVRPTRRGMSSWSMPAPVCSYVIRDAESNKDGAKVGH